MNEQMPKSEEKSEEPMGLEEAGLEANMMRVKMRETIGHEPTAEDYNRALKVVEELKEKAMDPDESLEPGYKLIGELEKYFGLGINELIKVLTFGKKDDKEQVMADAHFWDSAKEQLEQLKEEAEKLN